MTSFSQCFVPNCKNTTGIPFPKDSHLKQKWLESLKLQHGKTGTSSFICLNHFEDPSIRDFLADSDNEVGVVQPLIPKALSQNITILTTNHRGTGNQANSHNVSPSSPGTVPKTQCENRGPLSIENGSENEIEVTHDKGSANSSRKYHKLRKSLRKERPVHDLKPKSYKPYLDACRLCMSQNRTTKNVFEDSTRDGVTIIDTLRACLHPLEISKMDELSKEICLKCLDTLVSFFRFRAICLQNDKLQRKIKIHEPSKRKCEDINSKLKKKLCVKDVLSPDKYYENYLGEYFIKKEELDETDAVKELPGSPPPLVLLKKESLKPVEPNTDNVEQALRKVLQGTLTPEEAQAENIIFQVANDDERHCPEQVPTLNKLKLPLIIKPNTSSVTVKKYFALQDSINACKFLKPKVAIKDNKKDEKTSDTFQSEIGIYEGVEITYLFEKTFCMVDGYPFEYRLCKGDVRGLRCILPSCMSTATQNQIKPGMYTNMVKVQKAHNHIKPVESERKKQMFYHIMRCKMYRDRSLNFRSVYEEICTQDSEIKKLIPLKSVITEICRHHLSLRIPIISSFEQFYDLIEEDTLQKLQFTNNGQQFYQERFTADDGSMGILFGNGELIQEVSGAELMYVDASFKIDTEESFNYQLVTVLVWIDESYYPIVYALITRRSQEIYRKIFEYIYNTLAPNLRPEEIVSDYEANLYYALGEIYVDASIGGSVFYYTQNMYKKVCSLNLSRDLETNSYFRNIYHMLLMLPLLPVNTILDGLSNIEIQARDIGVEDITKELFEHVYSEWIEKVTPDLFCVHRLENRINENVIAPFKKLRDYLMVTKGKSTKCGKSITNVVEKLIELETFLQVTYSAPTKKSFARDLSSSQKRNVVRAWQFIENHPKININNFFTKVLGYIKCMENQLWIWGFYRCTGLLDDELINSSNFSIISSDPVPNEGLAEYVEGDEAYLEGVEGNDAIESDQLVMEAVIDENGGFVLQNKKTEGPPDHCMNYVYSDL